MTEKVLEVLIERAPELAALIWSIWYMGGKLDRLTSAIYKLREDVRILLDRGEFRQVRSQGE